MSTAETRFRDAAAARGLILPDPLEADGKIHRCRVEGGKGGRQDGSYLLHLDGTPAGGFQNFRDGFGWTDWHEEGGRELTYAERLAESARIAAMQRQRAAEEVARQRAAAERARRLWRTTRPVRGAHPYLATKGVNAYGIRALRDSLVIPLRDADGRLWSLQFIGRDGSKRFLIGGRKRGCYFAIGDVGGVLCVAEGYATGASIFAATGHATAIAFDAGNLRPVAEALHAKFPNIKIILCADNDLATPGNPGVTNATLAAQAVDGLLAVPYFGSRT